MPEERVNYHEELQKALEDAYKTLVKERSGVYTGFAEEVQKAYEEYVKKYQEIGNDEKDLGKAQLATIEVYKDYIKVYNDIKEQFDKKHEEVTKNYTQALRSAWSSVNVQDLCVANIAEVSRIIWSFVTC